MNPFKYEINFLQFLLTFQKDCVSTICGHSFERSAIKDWLTKSTLCPLCNKEIGPHLIENFVLRQLILDLQNSLLQQEAILDEHVVEPSVNKPNIVNLVDMSPKLQQQQLQQAANALKKIVIAWECQIDGIISKLFLIVYKVIGCHTIVLLRLAWKRHIKPSNPCSAFA